VGCTLVPLIFLSDGTHLSNFAGDKKESSVYMIIGNISLKIRKMPSTHSVVIVALLPIPNKNSNIPQKRLDVKREANQEMLNDVLRQVLQPFSFKQHPSTESGYDNILYADGNFSLCKPGVATWIADCPDYSDLHHLEEQACIWGECPKNEHGDYVHPDKQHPRRDHNPDRMLSDANR